MKRGVLCELVSGITIEKHRNQVQDNDMIGEEVPNDKTSACVVTGWKVFY